MEINSRFSALPSSITNSASHTLLQMVGIDPARAVMMKISLHLTIGKESKIYRVMEAGNVSYLKITHSMNQYKGAERRRQLWPHLSKINQCAQRTIIVEPLCLHDDLFEYPSLSQPMVTWWSKFPEKPTSLGNSIDPIDYSPSDLRAIMQLLYELQQQAAPLFSQLDSRKLRHEYCHPVGYLPLRAIVLYNLGLSLNDNSLSETTTLLPKLKEQAKRQREVLALSICQLGFRLQLLSPLPLDEQLDHFAQELLRRNVAVKRDQTKGSPATCSFAELLLQAEEQQWWSLAEISLGREIARLLVAQEMIQDILLHKGHWTLRLLDHLAALEERYRHVAAMAEGLVVQECHPLSFLREENNLTLIDLDHLSYGYALIDMANYAVKITRGFADRKILQSQAVELLDAILLQEWVASHAEHLLDIQIVSFWNHSLNLCLCYGGGKALSTSLDLTVTLSAFVKELEKRQEWERIYREILLPHCKIKQQS